MLRKLRNLAILASSLVLVTGCAVFDGGKVPPTTLSANGGYKPTLSYSSLARTNIAELKDSSQVVQDIVAGELLSVLEDSDYFSRIAKGDESAEIKLNVVMTNRGNPAALVPAVITGLSLYAIPSWATDHFEVIAKAERKDGLAREYTLADSTTLVQWLPMIFAFPVKNFSVVPEVRKNMSRKVLADMQADGFFDRQTAAR